MYVESVEGYTGKSAIALGVLEQLSRRVERIGVFRPIVRAERTQERAGGERVQSAHSRTPGGGPVRSGGRVERREPGCPPARERDVHVVAVPQGLGAVRLRPAT